MISINLSSNGSYQISPSVHIINQLFRRLNIIRHSRNPSIVFETSVFDRSDAKLEVDRTKAWLTNIGLKINQATFQKLVGLDNV